MFPSMAPSLHEKLFRLFLHNIFISRSSISSSSRIVVIVVVIMQ
jgi:hypothetical protein